MPGILCWRRSMRLRPIVQYVFGEAEMKNSSRIACFCGGRRSGAPCEATGMSGVNWRFLSDQNERVGSLTFLYS